MERVIAMYISQLKIFDYIPKREEHEQFTKIEDFYFNDAGEILPWEERDYQVFIKNQEVTK